MEKPWFLRTRRTLGYRIAPHAWQGWAIILASIVVLALIAGPLRIWLTANLSETMSMIAFLGFLAVSVAALLAVMFRFSVSSEVYEKRKREG